MAVFITKFLPRLHGMKMKCLSLTVLVIVIMALVSTFSPSLFPNSSQMSHNSMGKMNPKEVEVVKLGAVKESPAKSGMQLADEIKLEDTSGMEVEERLDKMNLMLQVQKERQSKKTLTNSTSNRSLVFRRRFQKRSESLWRSFCIH